MGKHIKGAYLVIMFLVILSSALLDQIEDLGIDLLIILEIGILGFLIYHYEVEYENQKVDQSNPEIKYVFSDSSIDYLVLFKICCFVGGVLISLGIGFMQVKTSIAGVVFISPLIWFGPHRKVRPFKIYRLPKDWRNSGALTAEEDDYLQKNATKVGLKYFSLSQSELSYKLVKGNVWMILFFLPSVFFLGIGGYQIINDFDLVWIFVLGLGISATFTLFRMLYSNTRKNSNLFLLEKKSSTIHYPVDISKKKNQTNTTIPKEKVKGVVFTTSSEYKEKISSNSVRNYGRYYSYKVLLKVGGKYYTALEFNYWNKPRFNSKKFAFLFAKKIANFLNVKLTVNEGFEA